MKNIIVILVVPFITSNLIAEPNDTKATAAPNGPVASTAPAAKTEVDKGTGIFVEGFGSFTKSYGSGDSVIDGTATAPYSTKTADPNGFGFGANLGYQLFENLGILFSFQYRSITSREWSQTNSSATSAGISSAALTALSLSAGTGSAKIQNKRNSVVLGLGVRPVVKVGFGKLYAGGGLAFVLPHDDVTTYTYTGINVTSTQIATATTTRTTSWNLGLGAYAEMGYLVDLTDGIYAGLGLRMLVSEVSDKDKDTVSKTSGTGSGGTSATISETTTGADSIPAANAGNVASDTNNPAYYTSSGIKKEYKTYGITDISLTLMVGFRF